MSQKFKLKVEMSLPVVGIEEIEADTEQDAIRIAHAKYNSRNDKKDFNVSIFKEEITSAVPSTGDVRSTERSDDPNRGSQSETSEEGGQFHPLSET